MTSTLRKKDFLFNSIWSVIHIVKRSAGFIHNNLYFEYLEGLAH